MTKPIKEIANELLDSQHNNGWGIQAGAIQEACRNYQVEFSDLFQEICTQSNIRDAATVEEEEEWND